LGPELMVATATNCDADAVHPRYGCLSEKVLPLSRMPLSLLPWFGNFRIWCRENLDQISVNRLFLTTAAPRHLHKLVAHPVRLVGALQAHPRSERPGSAACTLDWTHRKRGWALLVP